MRGEFDFDDDPDDRPSRSAGRRELDRPRERDRYDDRAEYGSRPARSGMATVLIVAIAGGGLMLVAVAVVVALVVRKATREAEPAAAASTPVVQTTPAPRPAATTLAKEKDTESAAGTPTQQVVEKVKRATVRIRVQYNSRKGGSGSGFVEKNSGLVLTNAHVLGLVDPKDKGPRAIELVVNSGEGPGKEYTLAGKLVNADKDSDLALIQPYSLPNDVRRVIPEGLTVPKSPNVSLLQRLFVFGYPFGEALGNEITVSETSVSSLRRDRATGRLAMVQVKGGMNPGNSGGPVVDVRGNVVGVAVAGIEGTDINFAIPGEVVQEFIARNRK
jgi:S1-C subfamily serine protease